MAPTMLLSGLLAALEVAAGFGLDADDPLVLQETNNLVVWLRPHEVVAKVGIRSDRAEALAREHRACTALVAQDMPVVRPVEGLGPLQHAQTGFTVTLWNRVRPRPGAVADPNLVGRSLQALQRALEVSSLELPDFRAELARARRTLGDDVAMAAMRPSDLGLLRRGFGELDEQLASMGNLRPVALHGEPHDGNYLVTSEGICWLDFESICRGPLEWDLAFLPSEALAAFPDIDEQLLSLLRTLNSARVATWCFAQTRSAAMRRYGERHLDFVKAWRAAR